MMNEEERLLYKTSIRKALYEQDIEELMSLIPGIKYEYAYSCIKEYQENYDDMLKRKRGNQSTLKEDTKEKNLLNLLLELGESSLEKEELGKGTK